MEGPAAPAHVFTYGSLMFAPVWERVTGGGHGTLDGTLRGYARRSIAGAAYPALVRAEPQAAVTGVVYLDVAPHALRALDHFEAEGEAYARIRVSVDLGPERSVEAWTYLYLHAEHVQPLEWDPERFEREDLLRFLGTYARDRERR